MFSSRSPEAATASGLVARLAWLTAFGAAFGYVEAAVVVYLRALYYPEGFVFPLVLPAGDIGRVEILREVATLVMLAAVAALTARSAWGRFGAFAVAFGVWDLAFYAGLVLTLGWPASPATWDVLFLIPGVWTGPVSSAGGIAACLIVCGAWILHADAHGVHPAPGFLGWTGAVVSLTLLLGSFLWNHGVAATGGVPDQFPWPVWSAGVLVGLATFWMLFRPAAWPAAAGRHARHRPAG